MERGNSRNTPKKMSFGMRVCGKMSDEGRVDYRHAPQQNSVHFSLYYIPLKLNRQDKKIQLNPAVTRRRSSNNSTSAAAPSSPPSPPPPLNKILPPRTKKSQPNQPNRARNKCFHDDLINFQKKNWSVN